MAFPIRLVSPLASGSRRRKRANCCASRTIENLESRQLLAGDGVIGHAAADEPVAIIQGFKWQDDNGNGSFDRGERGLAGVTIYADLNHNATYDAGEPSAVTQRDNPRTNIDETGHYTMFVPNGGEFMVREVVPDGFQQTYPLDFLPEPPPEHEHGDEFATVQPELIHLNLPPGEETVHPVEVTIHPFCILPVEIDLVSQDPDVEVENTSGVLTNGCGGDVSTFEVVFVGKETPQHFNLVAVDARSGNEFGFVEVVIEPFGGGGGEPGGHFVIAEPGQTIEGLDFGNQPTDFVGASIDGRKWSDENGNGDWDDGEPGLGGVTVYLDLNENGRLDRGEPSRSTLFDDPNTDFDESGLYSFPVRPGEYVVREVVPDGYRQTFPGPSSDLISAQSAEMDARGAAIRFGVNGVNWTLSEDGEGLTSISYGVTWPDGCARLHEDQASYVVLGDQIIVDLPAGTDSDACPDIISHEEGTVSIAGLEPGTYTVSTTLRETLNFGDRGDVASFGAVADIVVGSSGAHRYVITGGDLLLAPADFGNQLVGEGAAVHGTKWLDRNGNGFREDDEPGLAGVTIYLDVNRNGSLDEGEPSVETAKDNPDTRFDETGTYTIANVTPGVYAVEEVVPDGYRQTFPWIRPVDPWPGIPFEPLGRAHQIEIGPGDQIKGIDFGNQPTTPGTVLGTKWRDDNGNGRRDDNEPGLAGVTIYADLNQNGVLDEGEPSAVSAKDNPDTDFDESGTYALEVAPGSISFREVVPDGFRQTFPRGFIWGGPIDPLPHPWPDLPIELLETFGPLDHFEWPDGIPFDGIPFDGIPFDGFDFELAGHFVLVLPGATVDGIDFGNQELIPGSVHGTKWLDANGNSQRDADEPGLPGVTIYADLNFNGQLDEGEPSTVTMEDIPETDFDEAGMYWLEGVDPGHVWIREVVPDGFMQTFPASHILFEPGEPWVVDGEPVPIDEFWHFIGIDPWRPFPNDFANGHYVEINPGQGVDGIDFGNQKTEPGRIQGVKWLDENGNGSRDDNEPGLAGVTIYVDTNLNGQFDPDEPHAVTLRDHPATDADETGTYRIDGIDPGFYRVAEVVPDGFRQTFPSSLFPWFGEEHIDDQPILDFLPFEPNHMIFIGSGQMVEGIDFGNQKIGAEGVVEGVKWEDRNGDGVRQDDEPSIAGVTIFADLNLNGELDRGEPTAITGRDDPETRQDEGGRYTLVVPAGENLILEIVPRRFQQIYPSPFRRVAHPFNLGHRINMPEGGEISGIDFGNQRITQGGDGVISGTKWIDFNANGVREDDEPGDANVVIYLDTNNNGVRDADEPSTETMSDDPDTKRNELGYYQFTNVPAGDYFVREDLPFGFAQSFPNHGTRFDSQAEPLSPGGAIRYQLSNVSTVSNANGLHDVTFTMDVTWRNGCGALLQDASEITFDGGTVQVFMTGMEVGEICTQAITTQSQSLTLSEVKPGGYGFTAVLMQQFDDGTVIENFAIEGKFEVAAGDAHFVHLEDGQHIDGLNFGNFPVPGVPADFDVNADGIVDDADIDIVAGAMNGAEEARDFDFTHDGSTDRADIDHLVENVLNSVYGDSNLDGVFNSSDLVKVFQAAEYEDKIDGNSTWAEGDWNGDGDFNTADLVFVFQKAQYSRAATAIDAAAVDQLWSLDDSLDREKKERKTFLP